jgi:hypothetical protein
MGFGNCEKVTPAFSSVAHNALRFSPQNTAELRHPREAGTVPANVLQ